MVVVHGFSCCSTGGIVPDQGSNQCLLHWQADYLTTEPPREPGRRLCIRCTMIELDPERQLEKQRKSGTPAPGARPRGPENALFAA